MDHLTNFVFEVWSCAQKSLLPIIKLLAHRFSVWAKCFLVALLCSVTIATLSAIAICARLLFYHEGPKPRSTHKTFHDRVKSCWLSSVVQYRFRSRAFQKISLNKILWLNIRGQPVNFHTAPKPSNILLFRDTGIMIRSKMNTITFLNEQKFLWYIT